MSSRPIVRIFEARPGSRALLLQFLEYGGMGGWRTLIPRLAIRICPGQAANPDRKALVQRKQEIRRAELSAKVPMTLLEALSEVLAEADPLAIMDMLGTDLLQFLMIPKAADRALPVITPCRGFAP